jgi:alpha-galactosidase
MSIYYDALNKSFHLQTKSSSYVLQVFASGHLCHLYWGKKLSHCAPFATSIFRSDTFSSEMENPPLNIIPLECPSFGRGDFRSPSFQVQLEDGSTTSELRYHSHQIIKGKPNLMGLPSSYVDFNEEATTLEITLRDAYIGLEVVLTYTAFDALDILTRSCVFKNIRSDGQNLSLLQAFSMSLDFERSDFKLLQFSGAWGREKHLYTRDLVPGTHSVETRRGISSAQQTPFIALMDQDATEDFGQIYGFNLFYSGNFLAQVEVNEFFGSRVQMGISPFNFSWLLEQNQVFQTPEVVMSYSQKGLSDLSKTHHQFCRKYVCRGLYRDEERPILVNNWEATYFDFTEEKIKQIASCAKELDIELFVLDDGWFGKRDSDRTSLGDWFSHKEKLPKGIEGLATDIANTGIGFGLWFEPEMVSKESELYKAHPDWCIHTPSREPVCSPFERHQLVLDLTRKDVRDYIVSALSNILKNAPISYVKWDMNRPLCDIGSAKLDASLQREFSHRYVLGLYDIMERITSSFPKVLFEGCSSGGGRFDLGILHYMPQFWTSDNTDAMERLKIQYGTSIIYPAITMTSHISASPNHQVGRVCSLETRAHVAMSGNFGYELDLSTFTPAEKEEVKAQVAFYKKIRPVIQFGDFYRILSPFEGNETAWMYVSPNQKEGVLFYFKVLSIANAPCRRIKLKGLDPSLTYQAEGLKGTYTGEELMYVGLDIGRFNKDFASKCLHFISLE